MRHFPLFADLAGRRVLVVGGGEVAARKVDLLLRAGADVTVVSPELEPRLGSLLQSGAIAHVAQEFQPEHLNGMRLAIAATDRNAVNAWVAHQAESRGINVNVVDDRELSRFIMPAIIDRSPILAAVTSGGDAPVLTRRLREKLEALLPHRLGELAKFSGSLRALVKKRLTDAPTRRRFWEKFFDGPLAADVLAGRDPATVARSVESALAQAESAFAGHSGMGEVALVGAGPGDPGLLTLRALRVLQNADVVLYDRLVSNDVLDLARRDAERIYVGKAAGTSSSQADINALLVKLALEGKRVCRLKGGDSFIFGRGGEELEALAQHGIRYEVVPGITAATGCAAYAGIPLTHREHAQSLTFVTGHAKDDGDMQVDWEALARPNQTIVFYMGLKSLPTIVARLLANGAPGQRAAAVVEQGTCATQRVVTGTLATLEHEVAAAGLDSPSLLIVGEVTRLHETLKWFSAEAATDETLAAGRLSA